MKISKLLSILIPKKVVKPDLILKRHFKSFRGMKSEESFVVYDCYLYVDGILEVMKRMEQKEGEIKRYMYVPAFLIDDNVYASSDYENWFLIGHMRHDYQEEYRNFKKIFKNNHMYTLLASHAESYAYNKSGYNFMLCFFQKKDK